MLLFDCHAHLIAPELQPRLEGLLAAAYRAGVRDIVAVTEGPEDVETVMTELPGQASGVRLRKAVGLHPERATGMEALPPMLDAIRRNRHAIACVGEVGLDYSPHVLGSDDPEGVKAVQQECLRQQVALAEEVGLAVNVHSRSAGHHTVALLQEAQCRRAVLHAFDGRAHYAEAAAAAGYYLSVPPCARRSPLMTKWIKRVPLDRLLLETDAPALAAEKGQVNEPENLAISCAVIAEVKGISQEEVARATRRNAVRLFFDRDLRPEEEEEEEEGTAGMGVGTGEEA